jgi:hypothetical protein
MWLTLLERFLTQRRHLCIFLPSLFSLFLLQPKQIIQSRLKVSGAGKLLYMFLFQVDGRYTENSTTPPFFNPFFTF